MSNIAIIFAAGHGTRMNNSIPKQYLEIKKKPILAYTIEIFERSPLIDHVVLVVLKDKINVTKTLIKKYHFNKILNVIPGGKTALESQYLGLHLLSQHKINNNDLILIHDGVRPLINQDTIKKAINLASKKGNAIAVSPANETISINNESNEITTIVPRESCLIIRAPQVFRFKDIYCAHQKAKQQKLTFVDSASMMKHYKYKLNYFYGPIENIKVTTENDFIVCKHFLKRENNE